jgi:hypothetical protein
MKKTESKIEFQVKYSVSMLFLLLFLHAAAIYAVFILSFSVVWQLLLIVLLLISFVYSCYQELVLHPRQCCWQQAGQWYFQADDGVAQQVEVLEDSYVTPWLVILRFRSEQGGQCFSQVVCFDALEKNAFKRLRVGL